MRIRPDQLDQMQTADGERLLAEIRRAYPGPADSLALITRLRRDWDADLVAAAMTTHALRVRARGRFHDADRLWLTGDGLEQATSDIVADHRVARFAGSHRVADLCCGIGGDLMALARRREIDSLLAVDRDALHVAMAGVNARIARPDVDLTTLTGDAESVDLGGVDGVFLDPARRQGGRRVGVDATSPPLGWAVGLVDQVERVGITTAPGIDHDLVPAGWELECIAVGSDLKENMLWSPALATHARRATVLADDSVASLTPVPGDPVALALPEPGMTIIDPNPAVTRAGLVQDLARQLGATMIDERIAFLLVDQEVSTSFGRSLRVVDSMPWHERRVAVRLRKLDAGAVDVRRRGLAGDVDAIARRLRGSGSRQLTVLMTRLRDKPWAVIAEDPGRVP
ncbi:MAG: class I SAM-dependent methyltransferase [Thermomicrobiales bacterium]